MNSELCRGRGFTPARAGWFTAVAAGIFLAWAGSAQEVTSVVVAPSEPIKAGSVASFWLHYFNPSQRGVTVSFRKEIPCRLSSGASPWEAVLKQRQPAEEPTVALAPGSFVRREYLLAVPAALSGQVVLDVSSVGANRLVLEVQGPRSVAKPAAPSEPEKAAKPDSEWQQIATADPADFFKRHFFPHEPFYFIAKSGSPTTKFQVSFKYRLFDPAAGLGRAVASVSNLHVGYTQTAMWDLGASSSPFIDTSYKPELLYQHRKVVAAGTTEWLRLDLQGGVLHESNGKSGADSRSLNYVYLKPSLVFGGTNAFQVTLSPRAWFYVMDLSDNPDIADYRGHAELAATVGWVHGLQLETRVRGGDSFDHGSVQLDLSFPLKQIPWLGLTWYLHAQYFTGYGETFLRYKERSDAFRVGFSLYR
ncbi:MAG: phospholipase A [Verrucomicrobia bacterium]|nr:phospholipase A [Verrucomicrobiota bacterium]